MDMTPQEYQEYVKRLAPKSAHFQRITAFAFSSAARSARSASSSRTAFSRSVLQSGRRHGDLDLPHLPLRTF